MTVDIEKTEAETEGAAEEVTQAEPAKPPAKPRKRHSDETADTVDLVVVRRFNDLVPGDRLDGIYRSARVAKWIERGVVRIAT